MNIAFIWNFKQAKEIYPNWRDGLRSAVELIGKDHKVDWFMAEDCQNVEDKYDALLFWTDSNDELVKKYSNYHGSVGLCLTTDPQNIDNLRYYDVIFCESTPVFDQVRQAGLRGILAFGVDTNFFTWSEKKKTIPYFYPATFSPWKRQSTIAHLGKDLLCVGTVQPDGIPEFTECKLKGVRVEEGYFPVKKIKDYYQRSQQVIIPAIHGSERTVLEAMACGIRPIVERSNIKAFSYIEELDKSGLSPREFVVKNYSHIKYAEAILRGLE